MTSRYLQLENRKDKFGANLCPFWGFNPFWDIKIRRSHIYGTCASIDLKFGRLLLHNDVLNVAVRKFLISVRKGACGNGVSLGPRRCGRPK